MKRTNGLIRAALVALTLLPTAGLTTPSYALTTNLVPNPSFETSILPSDIVHQYLFNQPVLPVGWIFEGASELFDHTPNNPYRGEYAAQISGSWSTPRKDCSVSCVDTAPANGPRDQAYGMGYSVAPAWRTQSPVPVSAGSTYTFSSRIRLSIVKDFSGAVTRVRWVNAQGVPVGYSNGPVLTAATSPGQANYATFVQQSVSGPGPYADRTTSWTYKFAEVTAPAGATGAILLLGYSDDAWIGSVAYDYVCFGTKSTLTNDVCRTTYAG